MLNGNVETIVIVGGGSAGWMSAAYLSKSLPHIKIILVESSDIPTIGVGEATITTINGFLNKLGMQEKEWMPRCNASFKYGIRFDDWFDHGHHYWHPFESIPYLGSNRHLGQYWYLKYLQTGKKDRYSFYTDCFLSVQLNLENKIIRKPGSPSGSHVFHIGEGAMRQELRVPYAFHFDAGLFGNYIKEKFRGPDGVEQIIDDVTNVNLDESGAIASIETKGGLTIEGDLFLDCTGFRALLIDKTLEEPFDSYSETLMVDRAIAMRIPYKDHEQEARPYTTTTAKSAGWIWNIPVTERIGTGYVYCSQFATPEDAEREFREHLGPERCEDVEARNFHIGRVGKHRNTWVKNCVSIGLSSGFLEPLESTSLHFVYAGVAKLTEALSEGYYNVATRASYNSFITRMMEESRDFIALHYALTRREDTPFWKEIKYNMKIPDTLASYLETCRLALPNAPSKSILFEDLSWTCVLIGMNYLPNSVAYSNITQQEMNQQMAYMQQMRQLGDKISRNANSHYTYLKYLSGDDSV